MQIEETFTKLAAGTGIRAAGVMGGLNEQRQLQTTPGRLSEMLFAST